MSALKLLANNNANIANPITQALLELNNKINNNNLTEKTENNIICSEIQSKNFNNNAKNNNLNFSNNNKIKKQTKFNEFNFPIFIINGKEESLTYFHCMDFVKKFKIQNSWFPTNANYINLIQICRKKFYEKIKEFVKKLVIYECNDSFCGFSISEDKTNVNANIFINYNNNKLLMRFLKNKTRQESEDFKEDNKNTIKEERYLLEMEESKY